MLRAESAARAQPPFVPCSFCYNVARAGSARLKSIVCFCIHGSSSLNDCFRVGSAVL